jgi:hypothetical protein
VQTAALEQIKEVFMELRKASPDLLEQAVSNFPPLITRSLGYSNRVRLYQVDREYRHLYVFPAFRSKWQQLRP